LHSDLRHYHPAVLTDLRLADFLCCEQLLYEPSAGTNFLIGANARGRASE
jgi:recombinational DNA repair ATPase RecF